MVTRLGREEIIPKYVRYLEKNLAMARIGEAIEDSKAHCEALCLAGLGYQYNSNYFRIMLNCT